MLEEDLSYPIKICGPDGNITIKIKGIVDRIDTIDNQLRIGDYKTGKVEKKDLKVDKIDPDITKVPEKWFQVMTYAWLYCRSHHLQVPFTAGIFPLQSLGTEFLPISWCGRTELTPDDVDNFEQLLVQLISEIMNPNGDGPTCFSTSSRMNDSCNYCPLKASCQKETD